MARNNTPKVPQFGVYIGKYGSYTISGIPDGTYILYYTYGNDWDGSSNRFTQPIAYLRADDNMVYTTNESDEYIYYDTYTITLNPIFKGNLIAQDVDPSDFPKLG